MGTSRRTGGTADGDSPARSEFSTNPGAAESDSKRLLEGLFSTRNDGVTILDRDLRVTGFNETVRRWFGLTDEALGKPCREVFRAHQDACRDCPSRKAVDTGFMQSGIFQESFPGCPPGSWIEITCHPLRDDRTGEITGVVEHSRDITGRLKNGDSILSNEQFSNAIISESPIGISVRSRTGRLLSCNRAWQNIWGMSREEVQKDLDTERDALTLDDRDSYIGEWTSELRRIYEKGGSLHIPDMRTKRNRPGAASWVSQHFYAILDESGSVDKVVILTEDVSERKAAEASLKESEGRYRTLAESSKDMIFVIGADDTVRFVNGAAATALALPPEMIIGRERAGFFDGVISSQQQASLSKVMSDGAPAYYEGEAGFPTGTRWLGTWLTPLEDSGGGMPGILGVSRDISERVESERREASLREQLNLSQRMESVGRLAGGVAHDFNNLLTVILGHVELALESSPPGPHPIRSSLVEIRKAGERARDLTWQLLAFGRRQVLVMKEVDLNEVIRGFSSIVTRLIGEDVRIETDLDPSIGSVMADPGQIEQVIMNLAVNARDAMPYGGTIGISTRRSAGSASGDRFIDLSVSDTGSGMDEETLAHLFEPFFTTKETGKGTGLGLSTVYGIVNQHGGQIRVESRPGEGSVFTVSLPETAGKGGDVSGAPEPAGDVAGSARVVMVVEDDRAVRGLVCGLLRHAGYRVIEVEDPLRAEVEVSAAGRVDLLVTDMVMPGMNGEAVADAVCRVDPSIRILFISGYPGELAQEAGTGRSAGFLLKPFSAAKLFEAVKKALIEDEPAMSPAPGS
ncbi:MAG TPA: PAS domain-containing protein [Candidatus Fermentibacter sp.]|nr:PAS domain-containing protein [Candidatus Fermentibacter sp.]